jgi:PAS domain S-box-containing protein
MFKLTDISIVLFITTVINVVVTLIVWKRRRTTSGLYFALGMMSVTIWTLTVALGYAAVPLQLKIIFAKIDAAGYSTALVFFLFFGLYFAGLDEWANKRWLRVCLFLIFITIILLVVTNEWHGWIWQGFKPVGNNVVVFEHGPGFFWFSLTGYSIYITMIAVIWSASRKGSDILRRQARLLFYASLFPIVSNMVYLYGIKGTEGVDWSSLTFSITGILFLWALYGIRFMDLVPIARDQLVNSQSDGMIVVDVQARIIDINPAAVAMLGKPASSLIGKGLQEVMPLTYSRLTESPKKELRMEFEVDGDSKQYFDVLVSPLHEKGKFQQSGDLIVFRNITERKNNELHLLQLTQAVQQSPMAVVITDTNGIITFANPFFTLMTGYTSLEVIGKNPDILKSGQTPDELYQDMWQTILSGRVWNGEFLNKKKAGELYWVNITMSPVLDSEGNIQSFIAVQEDITSRKLVEQALESRFLEIQTLNKELQEAQTRIVEQQRALAIAQERQRIGRNLHDSVNQSIHSLMLFSETLIALLQNGETEQAIHAAKRIHESGEQALREVRLLVHEGHAIFISGYTDLIEAINNRLSMVERRVGIQADFSYDLSALENSPTEWMENIYWIILEGLNNSLKHSQASRVHVSIVDDVDQLTVEVKDNGVGFDLGAAGGGGFGMESMRGRAVILGGVLSVESSSGHGTRIKCVMEIPRS